MPNDSFIPAAAPRFSIIIAVYNDWGPIQSCLQSLAAQTDNPNFEVVIVDDGSEESAGATLTQWKEHFPLTIFRQSHAGIATARNFGARNSRGSVLVFTDADCLLDANCLSSLEAALNSFRLHNCFQLCITGDDASLLRRAEKLRLVALQNHALESDGRIRYLNTSGFAIRRTRVGEQTDLFVPGLLRGEDTLLLASLIEVGELPFFVPNAFVVHAVSMSFLTCLRKDLLAGWREDPAYKWARAKGIRIRMSNKDRFRMFVETWKTARDPSIGRRAWFVLIARQAVQRIVTLYRRG
jgi:glycosyltransferase involved in cell wall biosynthesis